MSYHVLYAAHPPQFSVELSLAQLAARDARFRDLRLLRVRRSLDLAVQDSADLQGAHLRLRLGGGEWTGTPGALDEDGSTLRRPFHGWSEAALTYALGLDLVPLCQQEVALTDLEADCTLWPTGVAYAFARPETGGQPALVRRLNLAGDLDRLEFEFLAATGFAGLDLLRLHRLGADGGHVVVRAAASSSPATAAVEVRRDRWQD